MKAFLNFILSSVFITYSYDISAQELFFSRYDTMQVSQQFADGIYTYQNNLYVVSYNTDINGFYYTTIDRLDISGNVLATYQFDTARVVNMFAHNNSFYYVIERDKQARTEIVFIRSNANLDTLSSYSYSMTNTFSDVHHFLAVNADTLLFFGYENDFNTISQQKLMLFDNNLSLLSKDSVNIAGPPRPSSYFYHFWSNNQLVLANFVYLNIQYINLVYKIDFQSGTITTDTLNLKQNLSDYNQFFCNNPGVYWDITTYDGAVQTTDSVYFSANSIFCKTMNSVYTLPSVISTQGMNGYSKYDIIVDTNYTQTEIALAGKRNILLHNNKIALFTQEGCAANCLTNLNVNLILTQSSLNGNLISRYKITNDSLSLTAVDFISLPDSYYLLANAVYKTNNPNYNSGVVVYRLDTTGYPTGIHKQAELQAVIYPNPAKEQVFVTFEQPFTGNITLFDITGKIVSQQTIINTTLFSMFTGNLDGGIYLVKMRNKDSGSILIKKIIIE